MQALPLLPYGEVRKLEMCACEEDEPEILGLILSTVPENDSHQSFTFDVAIALGMAESSSDLCI